MSGYRFTKYIPNPQGHSNFEKLMNVFIQLLIFTAGEVSDAMQWLSQLDEEYRLTDDQYGLRDFLQELKDQGYIDESPRLNVAFTLTAKMERIIRQRSLDEIFGKLKKSRQGNHHTTFAGHGDEQTPELRDFEFGDSFEQIAMTESIKNAQINHGISGFFLTENDLEVTRRECQAQTSTVLMIDISHSMVLYGEDRITPAKKVAMALAELITTKYPKDTLDILVFGNDAWKIDLKDIPYLQVGPYHTNTVAGLELALNVLKKRKSSNKQIFMITDGKPTCLKEGLKYYKNSFGLDRKIINKTLNQAAKCRRLGITITTFMVARDAFLQRFVREFTKTNQGRAFYTSLKGLGEYVFEDYIRNKRKRVR